MAKDEKQPTTTSASREAKRVEAAKAAGTVETAELKRQHAAAIADGDTAGADKIGRQLDKARGSSEE